MKISEDALFCLMTKGYVTLQVPAIEIFIPNLPGMPAPTVKPKKPKMINIPDDYLCELKHCGSKCRPTIGKEQGYLYITEKGYKNLKPQIRKAFLKAHHIGQARGCSFSMTDAQAWAVFEAYAKKHFTEVNDCIKKQLKQYEAKVKELKNMTA